VAVAAERHAVVLMLGPVKARPSVCAGYDMRSLERLRAMQISLNIEFEVSDPDKDDENLALDILDAECHKFAAHVVDVLEASGLDNISVRLSEHEDSRDDE
jgi:hypothetical protein